MKKIFTFLTGIAFVFTILISCVSIPEINNGIHPLTWEELDTVIIYLKAITNEGGQTQLEMYDSNYPDSVKVNKLETFVRDSTVVIWTVVPDNSRIEKIIKVKPKSPDGKIMHRAARGLLTPKIKKHKVPDEQEHDAREEYLIKFRDTDGEKHVIDPYLKIPPQSGGTIE